MELNAEQIKTGLVNFINNTQVKMYYPGGDNLIGDALALIKQLTEENDRLREILHTDISFVCVSRGSGQTNHLKEVARLRMDEVRAYAVREMHSKIKDRCIEGGIYPAFVERVIDQIAKDMLEGNQ